MTIIVWEVRQQAGKRGSRAVAKCKKSFPDCPELSNHIETILLLDFHLAVGPTAALKVQSLQEAYHIALHEGMCPCNVKQFPKLFMVDPVLCVKAFCVAKYNFSPKLVASRGQSLPMDKELGFIKSNSLLEIPVLDSRTWALCLHPGVQDHS